MFNDAPLGGLASLLATIRNLYPNAQVTSGFRGPNNPLTKRNPASLHAQGSPEDPRAVDVAPIPGMTFDQYVASVKKAGVPIGQAFDEAKHPFPWTTGPNWHLASGDAKPMQPLAPNQYDQSTWGRRPDGSAKGTGFLGVLRRPDGNVSTEISVGLPVDGREMDIPTLVPGLSSSEVNWLLRTPVANVAKRLPDSIRQKAITNAMSRIGNGLSPFKEANDMPYYPSANLSALAPVSLGAQEPAQAMMGQIQTDPILDSLKLKKNNLFSRKNVGSALGIIGDALMAYGGMQPQFGPGLRKQQEDERQNAFDLAKWNAALEEKRQEAIAKAQEPPQWLQDAGWFSRLPPEQKQQVLSYRDAMYPVTAFDPTRGTVRVPRSAGGAPQEAIAELRDAVSKGDTGAIAEFEQTFGQGSASQYLGGY